MDLISTRVNCLTNNWMTFVVTFLYNFWTVVKAQTRPSERLQQCNILTLIRTRKLAFRCEPDPKVKSFGTHYSWRFDTVFKGKWFDIQDCHKITTIFFYVTFCVMVIIFNWEILIIWKKNTKWHASVWASHQPLTWFDLQWFGYMSVTSSSPNYREINMIR